MLWEASRLRDCTIRASDGEIGSVQDFLFDDSTWTLRWMTVDTGTWLPGRLVLLPTSALRQPDPTRREFPVDLSRDRIKESPGIDEDAPVSRQMETDVYAYYGWTPYWVAGYPFAGGTYAGLGHMPTPGAAGTLPRGGAGYPLAAQAAMRERQKGDPHLRSMSEVTGYYIHARGDSIGHVEEFLIEDKSWVIRYLVVDTKNWWPGKMVLLSPEWIERLSWEDRQVFVDLTREQVRRSPEYDRTASVGRSDAFFLRSSGNELPAGGK
jgi:hypothetical protein